MDNPSAFPLPDERMLDGSGIREGSPGMTLRDWFAGQALAGIIGAGNLKSSATNEVIACAAYSVADAMLAERAKAGPA